MHSIDIKSLLETFEITEDDILQREVLSTKIDSLSKILVNDFFDMYLKDNKRLLDYFKYVDANRVLKNMKLFLVNIFTTDIDDNYFQRIEEVGYMHHSIKLDVASVKYSFLTLTKIINKISKFDTLVDNNKELILKFLALTEYVITDTTYSYREHEVKKDTSKSAIILLDKLYNLYLEHKDNSLIISDYFNGKIENSSILETIPGEVMTQKFIKLHESFKQDGMILKTLKINMSEIIEISILWNGVLNQYKEACGKNSKEEQKKYYYEMQKHTKVLSRYVDEPLIMFSTNAFLSLNAGIKVMRSVNKLFENRDMVVFHDEKLSHDVVQEIKNSFTNVFSWAIEEISVDSDFVNINDYDHTKRISFIDTHFYIAIKLKSLVNKLYLEEIVALLLDAIELMFSIKAKEQSLVSFAQTAEDANKSKDIFLASMSHELRTPINAITGFSQVLMMRKDTPQLTKQYVEKINIAGNNLLDIVNTILDFAKIEAGKIEFSPKFSSIYLLLKEVENLMMPIANEKNIELDIVLDLHLYIMLDPKLFKQVLLNLVANSIKFTPDNGKIWLDFNYENSTKSYHFKLCDNGVGISKENQDKLFKPFTQVKNIYQNKESGTGLGLVICKNIVEKLHKGRIWIESEKNKGSCFNIDIPSVSVVLNTERIDNASAQAKHFLIVDSSVKNKNIYTEKLSENFQLTFTDSNDGAKNLLHELKYDLIILSFYVADGIASEVLQYLEDEEINVPVILVSSEQGLKIVNALPPTSNIEMILETIKGNEDIQRLCNMLVVGENRRGDFLSYDASTPKS